MRGPVAQKILATIDVICVPHFKRIIAIFSTQIGRADTGVGEVSNGLTYW